MAGGRQKGRKNLNRVGDSYFNQHRVEITVEEKRELENAVRKANRLRQKMLDEAGQLPRKVYGKETGDTISQLQMMGKESDFILSQKSASLQRFRTRKDFDRYMDNLKRVNHPDYIIERTRAYKRNFIQSLEDVYGDEAKDIVMKVRMMKPEEYMRMVESDESLEISYVDSQQKVQGRLNQLRASLGMKLKDEWTDDEYDVD